MVKRVGKYELGRTLGEGTFGKVKYAVNVETQEAVAIKVLDKEKIQKQNMGNQIKKEISIMKMVKHKFIVGMIEVLASKSKIFIVLDLVTGGEVSEPTVRAACGRACVCVYVCMCVVQSCPMSYILTPASFSCSTRSSPWASCRRTRRFSTSRSWWRASPTAIAAACATGT